MAEEKDLQEQEIFEVDPQVEQVQIARLSDLKARRDTQAVQHTLKDLSAAIDRDENLMPCIIDAVKSYATLGEICSVMRQKWGEYRAPTSI
jgi:methylmalonyl-CoA mutase N-terminal domain/subunit